MNSIRALLAFAILITAASAADLKIKVVDPRAASVAGAEVSLLPQGSSVPLGLQTTSSEGLAIFTGVPEGLYSVQVLAPGFAPQNKHEVMIPRDSSVTVRLSVATPIETVVVSATRWPAPEQETGSSVATLESGQLQTMQLVSASDALRFLPGAVVAAAGQRGALSSLFVRGGDSRYNKVIIDGVPVNEPGGTFDFGTVPLEGAERLEFLRGAQSTLYGSDAMTSVVQVFTRAGSTETPELRFGADGGNLSTAHGFVTVSGARGPFDYNLFADQFNTDGQGVNDDYSNALQGANIGIRLSDRALFRVRTRHSNSRTGVQGEWNFNGQPLIPPDTEQRARQNNLLGSAELTIVGPSRWQHRFSGFEYHHKRLNEDDVMELGRVSPAFGNIDFPFHILTHMNRAGFEYEGDYLERTWAQTTVGYQFEDENGFIGDLDSPPVTHGLRLNDAAFIQQLVTLGRLSFVGGVRFVHNTTFGNKTVPRIALTWQALKGGSLLSGTRLRFSYATGIKEPRLEESFANGPFVIPNPNLKAEENRAFEAGVEQSLLGGKYALRALYYNNLFRHQIDFATNPVTFIGQYVNVDKSIAHGAEFELHGRPTARLSFDAAYNYTSTQILQAPFAFDPLVAAGQPFIRRPKHSGSLLFTYLGNRWGGDVGGSFVGRRPDSDFLGFGFHHAAGYARVDAGGWYAINSHMSLYANVENALNKHYEEVVGYPALRVNFRAGMRFRIGGE
jgi:vitamin B12 transporter